MLKRLITAFFIIVIYYPGRFILKFIFFKIIVRFYSWQRFFMKKLGWSEPGNNFLPFLFNQKLVHLIVVLITILLVFVNLTSKTRAGTLYDNEYKTILYSLIESEFSHLEEDQLIEEFFDEEATVSPIQQKYLDNLTSVASQPQVLTPTLDETDIEGETTSVTQGGTAIVKPDIASTKITKRPRKETINYTVKPGDTVSTIAAEFEISVSTILWENDLSAYSIIRPGQRLAILPMSGLIHKVKSGENLSSVAKKYNIEEEKIMLANKLTETSGLQVGQKIIIPGAKKQTYASYSPTTYSGLSVLRDLVKPSDAKPTAGNKMNWPTVGHRITQYYSWRHHGIDIANKYGTAVYAADAGTVESIGWGKGYGNQIVINHGGGKKTRYAHLSKFYIKKGQKVSKGEAIGAMGSTGWSTGSHLHFEVVINGRKYNPLNYIK